MLTCSSSDCDPQEEVDITHGMTQLDRHYVDPRLVQLYDVENPRGADTDFYLRLASELNAKKIVDLGCGTGTLTCELAVEDRMIVGIDPSPAMLAVARRKPGGERVQWVEGTSSALGTPAADLALMTGNVAQIFLEDVEWSATLRDIHAGLRPGGYLAFESRNPEAKEWESWHRKATYAQLDSPYGPVQTWLELEDVAGRPRSLCRLQPLHPHERGGGGAQRATLSDPGGTHGFLKSSRFHGRPCLR